MCKLSNINKKQSWKYDDANNYITIWTFKSIWKLWIIDVNCCKWNKETNYCQRIFGREFRRKSLLNKYQKFEHFDIMCWSNTLKGWWKIDNFAKYTPWSLSTGCLAVFEQIVFWCRKTYWVCDTYKTILKPNFEWKQKWLKSISKF